MSGRDKNKKAEDSSGSNKIKFEDPVPVNKWNASAVKYALDDTLKKIAKEEFGFVENFSLMDQRLGICTIACSFSVFALIYDYLYFLMMGVLTLFTMYKEDNITMVALEKDEAGVGPDNVWTFRTTMSKFSDMYGLKVTFMDGETSHARTTEMEKSISSWFDKEGKIVNLKFLADVRNLHSDLGKSKKDI